MANVKTFFLVLIFIVADVEEHSFQLFCNHTAGGTRSAVTSHRGRVKTRFSSDPRMTTFQCDIFKLEPSRDALYSRVCDFRDSRRRCQHSHT